MVILYNTRDGKGKDIIKEVEIKEYPETCAEFVCPICGMRFDHGVRIKDIVSANFTDWAYVRDYICGECSRLFSLYFYSYEVSPRGIELFNAREASGKILGPHEPPFRLVITTSRKKHLFYKSAVNYDADAFAINLEEETIPTTRQRMRELFDFVECLMTVGQSKMQMADGEMSMQTISKDSVVCACIADEAARMAGRELIIWAHVSDASFPGTEDTIKALADKLGRELQISRSEGSAYDALRNPQRRAFGKTGVFFDSIREWARRSGCDLCLTGVRAYESKRRMQAARAHGSVFHSGTGGAIDICNPITWFRLEDVAAAMLEYRAPIHPIYRKCAIGTRENQFAEDGFIRLGYITSRDIINKGTLVFIKLNYPEEWQKLCEAWPEAKNYC